MPTQIQPKFVERVWGKLDLAPLYPNQHPAKPIGEVWFDDGPLLIKFLFTSERLSVQVHPEDDYAAQHHVDAQGLPSAGKTEMWHILSADPGATLALGFREELSKDAARDAAKSGAIVDMLKWIPAKAGESYFVPAGTVHALGGGFVVCEIQQTSDITYRLFDYNRQPARELHLDRGFEVSRVEPYVTHQPAGDGLAACRYFETQRLRFALGPSNYQPLNRSAEALMILSGSGKIADEQFGPGTVWRTGSEAFTIHADCPVVALRTYVP